MSEPGLTKPGDPDCRNAIGTSGDRSCPELAQYVHCRNCPVFARDASALFDRPAPPGYLDDWAEEVASPLRQADVRDLSLLVFRLGKEWLALPTRVVVEVTAPCPVHRIPHRSNETLIGLVNLRGQLQLLVSFQGMIGVEPPGHSRDTRHRRWVVIRGEGQTWAFEAEEVLGVHRFARGQLGAVPATLANPAHSFSRALISWRDMSIGVLDESRVFESLKGLSP